MSGEMKREQPFDRSRRFICQRLPLAEVAAELAANGAVEVPAGFVELGAAPVLALLDIYEVGVEPGAVAADSP